MYKVLVMSELKKTVGIIGLGLIGGSMAIDLKKRGFAGKVLGVEADKVAAQAAMTIGLADEMVSLEDCVDRSDIIVVAVPVGAAVKMLPEILDRIHSGASAPDKKIVIDVCSTKERSTTRQGSSLCALIPWRVRSTAARGQPSRAFLTGGRAYLRTRRNRPHGRFRTSLNSIPAST